MLSGSSLPKHNRDSHRFTEDFRDKTSPGPSPVQTDLVANLEWYGDKMNKLDQVREASNKMTSEHAILSIF